MRTVHVFPDLVVLGDEADEVPTEVADGIIIVGNPVDSLLSDQERSGFSLVKSDRNSGKHLGLRNTQPTPDDQHCVWCIGGWLNHLRLAWFLAHLSGEAMGRPHASAVIMWHAAFVPLTAFSDALRGQQLITEDDFCFCQQFWNLLARTGDYESKFKDFWESYPRSTILKDTLRSGFQRMLPLEKYDCRISDMDASILRCVAAMENSSLSLIQAQLMEDDLPIVDYLLVRRMVQLCEVRLLDFDSGPSLPTSRLRLTQASRNLLAGSPDTTTSAPNLEIAGTTIAFQK